MTSETIALAADHAGYELKAVIRAELEERGLAVVDLGTNGPESVDYPDYGHRLAQAIETGEASRGILICGSGVGISMAANRHAGVRAALCTSGLMARLARQHNDANVLALGARLIGTDTARDCLRVFLATEFEGGRHQRRVEKMS